MHRHRIRRLMVEAWRLNKHPLNEAIPAGKELHVFLVFTGKEMPRYAQVLPAVQACIRKLVTAVAPAAPKSSPPTP